MKVTLKCNLRGKLLWRKGTVFEEPFPPEIEEELKACMEGRVDTLIIEETAASSPLVLFKKFDKPELDMVVYQKEDIQYDSNPWFLREPGARKKRQLLLRRFR